MANMCHCLIFVGLLKLSVIGAQVGKGLLFRCTSSSELGTWECGDGRCILLSNVCDGYYDCLSGHDELNCRDHMHGTARSSICRGESFSCSEGNAYGNICVAKKSYCDGIRDCEDGSDEPDTCPLSTLSSLSNFLQDFKKLYGDITGSLNPKSRYGPIFGGIVGIIVLFFSLLTLVAVTMTLCVCNKHCPIYKWRQRRGQPPVGVMIPTEVPRSEATVHLDHEPQEDSAFNIDEEATGDTTEQRSLLAHSH